MDFPKMEAVNSIFGKALSQADKTSFLAPHPSVRDWLDTEAAETLCLSRVSIVELMFGIGVLPRGKRKDKLATAPDDVLDPFSARILPFDAAAARHYAELSPQAVASVHADRLLNCNLLGPC
ncbi:PIN domain-containing protein [Bradyrhizobium guangxiense]